LNRRQSADITVLAFDRLENVADVVHAVSTRTGGVSRPPFHSLNLAFHTDDDPDAVLENRRRFARAARFALDHVVTTRQVHGDVVRVVGRADRGTGATESTDASWSCDALVTADAGVLLMGFAADCPLVMLVDAEAGVVALAHAGWRSAFAGIIPRTVAAMTTLGAQPSRTVAAVSPAIGCCCYEVGPELLEALGTGRERYGRFFRPRGDRYLLDLPGLCREMLVDSGVSAGDIEDAGLCTRCNSGEFFSYRAARGATGRIAAVIGRRDAT